MDAARSMTVQEAGCESYVELDGELHRVEQIADGKATLVQVSGTVFARRLAQTEVTADTVVTIPAYVHPWERCGLGRAPFRFTGMQEKTYQACPGAPIQPGSSCDYCGNGIRWEFWVASADGQGFKVGCDCIRKVCRKGSKVLVAAERAQRKLQTESRHAREAERIAHFEETFRLPQARAFLCSRPSPVEFRAKQGDTMLDHLRWCWKQSGTAGKLRHGKVMVKALRAAGVELPEGVR